MLTSTICTLVEGDYHLGLGALVNSLVHHGFSGTLWVGIRGPLPPWAGDARDCGRWHELGITDEVALRFVALETPVHFTNYKAHFLLHVWEDLDPAVERIFYFDPDIVIKTRWSFFEEWAGYGVALVADVNSPMPESHPRRKAWLRCLAARRNQSVVHETSLYVNGGFVGISRSEKAFLHQWNEMITLVGEEIGGLENSPWSADPVRSDMHSPAYPFSVSDQDALNIAVMTANQPISVIGAEGMDFRPGGWTMSHAIGPEKPWRKHMILAALAGRSPTPADRHYWRYAAHPLVLYSPLTVKWRRLSLAIASAIGRFYRRT